MKPNDQSNWQDYPQCKANLRQPEPIKQGSRRCQPEKSHFLQKSRDELETLTTLYKSLPCISFILNPKGIILSMSQFGAAYLGYDALDLAQKPITSVVYSEDQSNCQAKLTDLQQQPSQLSEWEARLLQKNGDIKWVRARLKLVPETQFNSIILLVCEDITIFKQMEKIDASNIVNASLMLTPMGSHPEYTNRYANGNSVASRQLEEENLERSLAELRYKEVLQRSIISALPLAFYVVDNRTDDILYFNHRFCEIWGIEHLEEQMQRGELKNTDIVPDYLFLLRDVAAFAESCQRLQREENRSFIEDEISFVDGRTIRRFSTQICDESDHYFGRLYVFEDITERKQAEAARRESSSRLKLALDAAQMGTWDWNIVTNEVVYSDQLRAIFGLPSALYPPTYETFLNSIHPEDHEYVGQSVTRAIEEGIDYGIEFRVVWPDGTVHWVGNKGQVYYDSAGKPMRMVGVTMNITERKQAEETLRQQFIKERLVGMIAQRIHQSLNLEEILNTTVAEVRQFLGCDRVIIFRLREDGSGVVVVEAVGSDWKCISGTIINDRYFAQSYIQLYQQGRVQAVEDIYTAGLTPCHVDLLAQFQVRANLVVPIVQEEQLWGLLVAQQCSETRQWQPLEIDLLKSLATQAAIAIWQSTLYEQAQTEIIQRQQAEASLHQQFQRESLVGAIAQRIRKSLNLEEILNATAAEVRQVLQTDRVIIFRFEPDWSGKVVVESVDTHCLPILGKNIYDPCFKHAYITPYQQGRVRAIEDIYTADLNQCHIDLLTQLQVRANLVVPILNGEQLWGLLIAHHCSEPRQWQQFEIDLLTSLASQAAIAIQQSQLYEQAKSLFLREQALNQLTQAIRRSLDLETIFSTATDEIEKLLQVDRTHIVQYLPERKLWVNVAESCKGLCSPTRLGLEISDENNGIAERLKRLEVVRIDDTKSFEDELNKDIAQSVPGAWLLVPLQFGSSVWGALGLVMNVGPYQWQETEVELICEVADQLAIALQQAELYNQSCIATATAVAQAQQLEQTLQQLQKAQAQLVQSEKMSSLGQLVAGVAHEINNPVSFIYGNLMHASEYTEDILGLIELYQQHYPSPTPEISSEIEAIDLDFLIEDLPKLLNSMKVGAERICEIVSSLRNFSRLAEAEMKAVDIHQGLDSTLVILQSRLKAQGDHPEIQVIKEYGNLPKVECYAGQLNQVFMNLLTNAIDAIDEQNQKREAELNPTGAIAQLKVNPRMIRVRTEVLDNHQIAIRIADNGPGMTEQVKARLFDPFFTTKPVGAGTGLGLSISYQIVVEKHGGQLLCFSELGHGTEFVIQIPLSPRVSE